MRIFLARFNGHHLDGEMIVVDETKRKAFNKAKKEISKLGLDRVNQDFTMDNVEEIDCSIKQVVVIDNGDY